MFSFEVFFYSSDIFSAAGLRDEKVLWGILATGVINLMATLVALKLIELLGRRPLIIWPLAGIIAIMIALTVLIVVNVSCLSLEKKNNSNKRPQDLFDFER